MSARRKRALAEQEKSRQTAAQEEESRRQEIQRQRATLAGCKIGSMPLDAMMLREEALVDGKSARSLQYMTQLFNQTPSLDGMEGQLSLEEYEQIIATLKKTIQQEEEAMAHEEEHARERITRLQQGLDQFDADVCALAECSSLESLHAFAKEKNIDCSPQILRVRRVENLTDEEKQFNSELRSESAVIIDL